MKSTDSCSGTYGPEGGTQDGRIEDGRQKRAESGRLRVAGGGERTVQSIVPCTAIEAVALEKGSNSIGEESA